MHTFVVEMIVGDNFEVKSHSMDAICKNRRIFEFCEVVIYI